MSYKTKAAEVAETAQHNPPMPCRRCHTLTPIATLNSFGALCGSCYAEYCRYPFPPKPAPSNSRTVREMRARLKPHQPTMSAEDARKFRDLIAQRRTA